jgi:hypothetical protein
MTRAHNVPAAPMDTSVFRNIGVCYLDVFAITLSRIKYSGLLRIRSAFFLLWSGYTFLELPDL